MPPQELRTRVSIRAERLPRPGIEPRHWVWADLLEGAPPRLAGAASQGRFVARHGFDDDPDPEARVGYVTTVKAEQGDVLVDEALFVERRVLGRVLRAEQAVGRGLARGSQAGARLLTRGGAAVSRRVGRRPGAVVEKGTGLLAGLIGWASDTVQDTLRAVAEGPDQLMVGVGSAEAQLGDRAARREFIRGLWDPFRLSREGKAAALFLAVAGLAGIVLAITLGVFFFQTDWILPWRALLLYFLLGLGSTLLFPFFPEFELADTIAAVRTAAPEGVAVTLTILSVSLGMSVGGWMVLFLGDAVHATIRRSVRPGSTLARALTWAEGFAARNGFWAAFLILAVPMGPDTPVFYILATVRTPPRQYLAGILLGTLVRFTLAYFLFVQGFGTIRFV